MYSNEYELIYPIGIKKGPIYIDYIALAIDPFLE